MKSTAIKSIIGIIFPIVFNVLFFLTGGTEHSSSVWGSYVFIHLAYLCLVITPLLCNTQKSLMVLSASLYLRSLFYFFTELVVGLLFMAIDPDSSSWAIIPQAIIFAAFLILQLISVLLNDSTAKSIQKQRRESIYIRSLAQQVKICMRDIDNIDVRKQVEKCYESLNNCSIESFPEAVDAEIALKDAVETLCSTIDSGNLEQITKDTKLVLRAIQNRNFIINEYRR